MEQHVVYTTPNGIPRGKNYHDGDGYLFQTIVYEQNGWMIRTITTYGRGKDVNDHRNIRHISNFVDGRLAYTIEYTGNSTTETYYTDGRIDNIFTTTKTNEGTICDNIRPRMNPPFISTDTDFSITC